MGLLRGIARTAVISGTATAVSGRVQRRQAERFAERDAAIISERQRAYDQQFAAPPAPPAPPRAPAAADPIQQLKELAALKAQGILTEEEFAAQKARVLAG
ncbi:MULTISPECIES: SHOCT domain-containing protein [unclassified Arthrobacter]|uniref:SHOCT domain-containing protein n=1 Tax=unclassified Arthrobacter TaxID=235627 RepID=UPI0014908B49|nr:MULTISPECIES: SHOCT domain-containing protein [unclassified Arthrobacter]MBE0010739.1 SHOCT domain-containing protein [Arthrobacter sp. AET 35A]NOJ64579.1 SHOCT domain-containing protein [Arthrobacter sp. 147(2020)]